jgi:hypothetical protein
VIDEAQRDERLVEAIVKRANLQGHFLFSGTPPYGEDCLNFNSSIYARTANYVLFHFDPYEMLALLKLVLNHEDITPRSWLHFWTIFAGEPYFYRQLSQALVVNAYDVERMATEGIYCESLHDVCIKIIAESIETGIRQTHSENNRMTGLKSGKFRRTTLRHNFIQRLMDKIVLEEVATLSEFISTQKSGNSFIFSWKDSLFSSDILKGGVKTYTSFRLRTELALEDMLKRLILHASNHNELASVIGCQVQNLSLCTLSYENSTDADLLLVENNDNLDDEIDRHHMNAYDVFDEEDDDADAKIGRSQDCDPNKSNKHLRKPKAFIYNVKTHPTLFLGESGKNSQKRFGALCKKFAPYFDVHLCLACVQVECKESTEDILNFWKDIGVDDCSAQGDANQMYKLHPKVVTLEEFLLKAPKVPVRFDAASRAHFVDRSADSHEIAARAERNGSMLLQGRHRVGKSSLLVDLAKSRDGWHYVEL